MANKKLILASILLMAALVSGVAIDAPQATPAYSSWGFSVDMPSGASATVSIGGDKVVEVYSSGAVVYGAFSPFISDAFIFNGTLYVYHFGLKEGTYTISVDSSDGTDSSEIKAFKAVDESFKDQIIADVDSKVNERMSKFDEYDKKFDSQDVDNKEFWRRINENTDNIGLFTGTVDSLKGDVSSLSGKLDSASLTLSGEIDSIDSRVAGLEGVQAEEEAARLAAEEEAKKSPIAGMVDAVGGVAGGLVLPLGVLVVLIIVVGAVLVFKDRLPKLESIYAGQEKDEYNLPVSREDEAIAEEVLSGGKWAYPDKE